MSSKQFKKSIFLFHRDLRLNDNTGLYEALRQSEAVLPLFILDPVQASSKNAYRSLNALQFMFESLHDLDQQLRERGSKLCLLEGATRQSLVEFCKAQHVDAVFSNHDYTPFAQSRDQQLEKALTQEHIAFKQFHDALLTIPEEMLKDNGDPYVVFTPFFKKAVQQDVLPVQRFPSGTFVSRVAGSGVVALKEMENEYVPVKNKELFVHGGTIEAEKLLKKAARLTQYKQMRDIPATATTGLSAHNKFGTVSIRRVYETFSTISSDLVRQLYWRDFFTSVAYFFPYVFKTSFNPKYEKVAWVNNKRWFKAWQEGITGFPLVDAGMRQLVATGYMHNRVRMVVASFLTKDLHTSWQWGEQFFAQHLVDYDPCVNNGSWQWAASTGVDAQPYFRIFNPWLQQKKFDPECVYIKQWIPELKHVAPVLIHTWYKEVENKNGYPAPIVDHNVQSKKAIQMFKLMN